MTTRSTASSGTEGPDPQDPDEVVGTPASRQPPVAPQPPVTPEAPGSPAGSAAPESPAGSDAPDADTATEHDAARRAFFFQFGKQAVTAVGQAAGMADIVGRTSSTVAASLLGLDQQTQRQEQPEFTRSGNTPVVSPAATPAADDSFRSAYRLDGDELVLLDQRGIPETLDEVVAKRGSDVAYYLRLGVGRGGPLMAQVAAYGLALTAAERASHTGVQRDVELRRSGRALVAARPSSRLLAWAVGRMSTVSDRFEESADGVEVAAALRAEADAIASGFQSAHAAIASSLAEALRPPQDEALVVLMHGDQGALFGGFVGTGLAALRRLRDQGRELRVFVTEGRPFMHGARLTSWELRQAGIDHKVIPDTAVAWLLDREPVDAVLIAAEWVAANGDVGGVIGSRAIAQQVAASAGGDDGLAPRVLVSGVTGVIDLQTADAAAIPVELRPARDMSAYLADVPIRASDALVPATDVMAAETVSALVTERGVAAPLTSETIGLMVHLEEGQG